ncbi:21129_t:CDS:2, partial [Cetraspora pellucida]
NFRYNEDTKSEFNENDEIESIENNDEAESSDENKTVSNKENEEIFETKTCKMLEQSYTTKKDILNFVQKIVQISGFATKDIRIFYEHHQLLQEAKHIAVQMLKASAKPSTIYEAIRDENREPT